MTILWLVCLALGVAWVRADRRITSLRKEVSELSRSLDALNRRLAGAPPIPIAPSLFSDVQPPQVRPADQAIPEPLARAGGEADPTPPSPPDPLPPPVAAAARPPRASTAAQAWTPPKPGPAEPETPSAWGGRLTGATVSTWLSENGLAWIGGGALALGGLLLVVYAAQRGVFTPALRILSAIVVGAAMLAAGEWIRRRPERVGERHLLAAALASAAGAATLYGAIWAAYALYGYIPATLAGALLAAVSLGLLGLALLHGEPLALLAIVAAFFVPLVVNSPHASAWSAAVYLLAVCATGVAASYLRSWSRAGALTLVGAGLWTLLLTGPSLGAASLLLIAVPTFIMAGVMRREPAPDAPILRRLPAIAVAGSWILWGAMWMSPSGAQAVLVLPGIVLAALFAFAAWRGLVDPRTVLAPAGALAFAALTVRQHVFGRHADLGLPLLAPLAAVCASALWVAVRSAWRREVAVAGAACAAVTLTLLQAPLASSTGMAGWITLAAAALLAFGAMVLARTATDPEQDLGLAAWVGAAAEALGLAIHAGAPDRFEPIAFGLFAAALAFASVRLRWRGLAEAAALAGLVALARLLGPEVGARALTASAGWGEIALISAGAVTGQAAAWFIVRRNDRATASRDALSTTAVLSALFGAFLVLRLLAMPQNPTDARLDLFAEAALRSILLLAAGLVLSLRAGNSDFGRWRGAAFLAAGGGHAVLVGGLLLNPLFSAEPVSGPPVVDTLLLGYLAPAVLLFAARRRLSLWRDLTAACGAGAAILALLWAGDEIRRLFHGPVLPRGGVGYSEAAAYGLALLSLLAIHLRPRRGRRPADILAMAAGHGQDRRLGEVGRLFSWSILALAMVLLLWVASPWWGPLHESLEAPALLFATLAAGLALTGLARRLLVGSGERILIEGVTAAAAAQLFALLTLAIRFGFHGGAMRAELAEASLETWTFSAAWALLGLGVLAAGVSLRDAALRWMGLAILGVAALKVLLFDLSRLSGVIRAASFLAVGALLLAGAVAARRLRSRSGPDD